MLLLAVLFFLLRLHVHAHIAACLRGIARHDPELLARFLLAPLCLRLRHPIARQLVHDALHLHLALERIGDARFVLVLLRFLVRERLRLRVVHGVRNLLAAGERSLHREAGGIFAVRNVLRGDVERAVVQKCVQHFKIIAELLHILLHPVRGIRRKRRPGEHAALRKKACRRDRAERIRIGRARLGVRARAAAHAAR